MIRNWYSQIPYPDLKTKSEITKYGHLNVSQNCEKNYWQYENGLGGIGLRSRN